MHAQVSEVEVGDLAEVAEGLDVVLAVAVLVVAGIESLASVIKQLFMLS